MQNSPTAIVGSWSPIRTVPEIVFNAKPRKLFSTPWNSLLLVHQTSTKSGFAFQWKWFSIDGQRTGGIPSGLVHVIHRWPFDLLLISKTVLWFFEWKAQFSDFHLSSFVYFMMKAEVQLGLPRASMGWHVGCCLTFKGLCGPFQTKYHLC